MTNISTTGFQRPLDIPPISPQMKSGADVRFEQVRRDAASTLLLNVLFANLNALAAVNRAPARISAIVLIGHAGKLQGAIFVLFPSPECEAETSRRDDQQRERTRSQRQRPANTHGAPPHRPTAQANPYAPDGWVYARLPHEILGLNAGETDVGKIGKAFRELSRAAHPDKGGSQQAMQELVAARDAMKAGANAGAGHANS